MASFFFVFSLLLLGACTDKPKDAIQLLTYSSLAQQSAQGDGLGSAIQKAYEKSCIQKRESSAINSAPNARCKLELIPEPGDSSLPSRYLKQKESFDGILGLSSLQNLQLANEVSRAQAFMFSKSPHAFLANTKLLPKEEWPRTWTELSEKFAGQVLLQDPRVSSAGLGLLKASFLHGFISLEKLKALSKKTLPSWSQSYAAFTNGEAPIIWSYQSSEAYHRCNPEETSTESESTEPQFRVIPLEEGYPQQEEWAFFSKKLSNPEQNILKSVILSDDIQKRFATENWMYPATTVRLPDCYQSVTPVFTPEIQIRVFDEGTLRNWIDQWSL